MNEQSPNNSPTSENPDGVLNPTPRMNEADSQDESASTMRAVWPGSSLDWSSPKIEVSLYVELPFWLMAPAGVYEVNHRDTVVKIEVAHDCDEAQLTPRFLKSHQSTAFIKRDNESVPEDITAQLNDSEAGWSLGLHRTTLIVATKVIKSVLDAAYGKSRLKQFHAGQYLNSLAVGHLPLVNALITAYRRASYDPFVQDVTEATVPIWFLRHENTFFRVPIYPYHAHTQRPSDPATYDAPLDLATQLEVINFLGIPETPGESILMDAWSYYYSGRFSDSIRALVTAVEVLLEAKLSELHQAKGKTPEQVESALKVTATKFLSRLEEYLVMSGRTVPGPQLSVIPYINGVRLRKELVETRELRHRIVHAGHRVNPHDYGQMQRAVETVTGFFGWLDNDQESAARRFSNYNMKSLLRGRVFLEVEYLADAVSVVEFDLPCAEDEELDTADDPRWVQYQRSLHGPSKDLDLFVKMSFAFILVGSSNIAEVLGETQNGPIEDRLIQNPAPGVICERYLWQPNKRVAVAVFVLDLDGILKVEDLSGVFIRLLQLNRELGGTIRGLCVVNHQRHLEPAFREVLAELSEGLERLLASCGVTVVFSVDLARYVLGARDFGWPLTLLQVGRRKAGYCSCEPPDASVVGRFVKAFPREGVIGVEVLAAVDKGCSLYIRTVRGFALVVVESIRVRKDDVTRVTDGQAGLKVSINVKAIVEASLIYRVNKSEPGETASAAAPD